MIRSSRNVFVGFNTTEATRLFLAREAERQGISVSLMLYRKILQHYGLADSTRFTEIPASEESS
jgi:hypothetical protein